MDEIRNDERIAYEMFGSRKNIVGTTSVTPETWRYLNSYLNLQLIF